MSSNLKNLWGNAFKIGTYFKEQPPKKLGPQFFKETFGFCFIKFFVFSISTTKDTKTIYEIW